VPKPVRNPDDDGPTGSQQSRETLARLRELTGIRAAPPVFVTLKPGPHDMAYRRAAAESMGRPGPSPATTSPRLRYSGIY